MVIGSGTTAERTEYTWIDTTAKPNTDYYYRLEDVSYAGDQTQLVTVRMHGFVSAKSRSICSWTELKF